MAQAVNPANLRQTLRQMLAVLETERQALAALDIDAILGSSVEKSALCGRIDTSSTPEIDDECRGLLDAARRMNELNRQVRNLVAANVAKRLDVLTGTQPLYHAGNGRPSYGYAGSRG
jgi:hypothetical protein